MEVMAACRRDSQEAVRLADRIEELEEMMVSLSVGQGVGGGSGGDKYAAYMARKDELSRRLTATRRTWAAECQAVILLTEKLPALTRESMRSFYGYGMSAARIAEKKHYSESSVFKALAAGRAAMREVEDALAEAALPGFYLKEMREEENGWNQL